MSDLTILAHRYRGVGQLGLPEVSFVWKRLTGGELVSPITFPFGRVGSECRDWQISHFRE